MCVLIIDDYIIKIIVKIFPEQIVYRNIFTDSLAVIIIAQF